MDSVRTKVRAKKIVEVVALALLVSAWLLPSARAGEVIDRIVATVNGHIILQSDWEEALRYEALLNGRALNQFTDDNRRAVLDRLIDQELLAEQMKSASFQHASEAEAAARVEDSRKQYPKAASDEGWRLVLNRFGLWKRIWWRMCSSKSISCGWWMLTFGQRSKSIPGPSKLIIGKNSSPS